MDIGQTIEFLLQSQARTETRIDAIATLLRNGMDMLLSFQAETRTSIHALIQSHENQREHLNHVIAEYDARLRRTEDNVDKLTNAMLARFSNGHPPQA